MSFERQVLLWAVAIAGLWYLLQILGAAVTPFAAGIALGYLLNPLAQKLESLGLNRLGAALLILVFFIVIAIAALLVAAPILGNQLVGFTHRLPDYVMRLQSMALEESDALLKKYAGEWGRSFGPGSAISAEQIQKSVGELAAGAAKWLIDALRSLATGGAAVVSFLSLLIVTPVVAFYILVDWNRMLATIDGWLPRDHREAILEIAREIDRALAGFLRGQSLVCLFLGLWYGVGLSLIGLDFGFLVGVLAGILSFAPYVGSLTALALGCGFALIQGWPSLNLFYLSLVVVVAGQFLEAYVISPKLVGESVGLHPVWLMFALFAFGQLFGFLGLLIAVPTAAAFGVLARRLLRRYLASPFYRGQTIGGAER